MRVLGIDPGLRRTGWGVIDVDGARLTFVECGTVAAAGDSLGARLACLHDALVQVAERLVPSAAAIEETFVNRNGASTLKLGQARGVALLVPARLGLTVGEYAPNAIKKAVVGLGHADKDQIAHMVGLQLGIRRTVGPDAADALAVAICHAHHLQTSGRRAAAMPRVRA